jgi:hypothetical protein
MVGGGDVGRRNRTLAAMACDLGERVRRAVSCAGDVLVMCPLTSISGQHFVTVGKHN